MHSPKLVYFSHNSLLSLHSVSGHVPFVQVSEMLALLDAINENVIVNKREHICIIVMLRREVTVKV